MENKIKVESLVEATIRVSNADDTARAYDIVATAKVRGGAVVAVTEGTLNPLEVQDPYMQNVTFDDWEGGRMQFEFPSGMADKAAALTAIETFVANCKASPETLVNK